MRTILDKIFGSFTTGKIDWMNISTATYVRYILTILASVNTILVAFNLAPIPVNDTKIYDVVSAVLFIVILLVNTYKDNPTSPEAIESNKFMKQLKDQNRKAE